MAAAFSQLSTSDLQSRVMSAKRLLQAERARDDLFQYMRFIRPGDDVNDPEQSAFIDNPLARLLCQIIEKMDRGELKRVGVSVGPQFGKSDILTRGGPAWLSGRDPKRNMIIAGYGDEFAANFGFDCREIMRGKPHQQVFPAHTLHPHKQATDELWTTAGGKLTYVGIGGKGTGIPADFFFVDDPIKNDNDARSATFREANWKWYNGVVFSRVRNHTRILIVHTRWHEDDLLGRLCDPDHPERNKLYSGIADRWTYYNLPAVVDDPKLAKALGLKLEPPTDPNVISMFGTKPMASIGAWSKDLATLAEAKQSDKDTFNALYMGKPSADEGSYFRVQDIVEYGKDELPRNEFLRFYGASDHATSTNQKRDATVIGCVGIDHEDTIWVMPDLVWERIETDKTVEEIIAKMSAYRPMMWWLEDELISKSFGPFLKRRMLETKTYCALDGIRPAKDKRTRARAIQGRMQMGKVRFPGWMPWWTSHGKRELLKFDTAAHDDFVDFMSLIGLGLTKEIGAARPHAPEPVYKPGDIRWIVQSSEARGRDAELLKARKGW